jgi:uncharacterized MnhB-related membrane protein
MERIQYGLFLLGAIVCAYRAIVSKKILSATIYLACISALVSAVLYLMGATQVAVMELSVGAGLVTVLLVYAVSVVGDDALDPASVVPKPLAFVMVGLVTILMGFMAFPAVSKNVDTSVLALSIALWKDRVLDVWIQIVLIFSGVMGVLGLLSEKTPGKFEEIQK